MASDKDKTTTAGAPQDDSARHELGLARAENDRLLVELKALRGDNEALRADLQAERKAAARRDAEFDRAYGEMTRLIGIEECRDRLAVDLAAASKTNVELRKALDEAREQIRARLIGEAVPQTREELRPGHVYCYAKLRYVMDESSAGQSFKPRQAMPGELIQVPEDEFRRDQAHRFPHLESEAEHNRRVAEQRKHHVKSVDGELAQIMSGFELAEQMAAVRAQQQQVTAQQLVDAQRLGAQMPQGPLPPQGAPRR